MEIRDVNKGIGYYHSDDNMAGLKDAVNSRRTFLALDHLLQIVAEQSERIAKLEAGLTQKASPKQAPPKKVPVKDDSADA